ncbi:30S ribosomal protein S2 [Paludisphaera soli]|uniref:30S ribosomal protein S2 n=1 Tax=Paludisphaera soli TaxID=2712865 RepID=UPI001F0EB1D2|nr:30S ribosomal protein S2 [Paludisphaera soli]
MSLVVKDLIDAGVHFGHRASRWNPKMKPYIYGKRNLIHIIDLKETVRGLLRATKYFNKIASQNGLILFVGTKRQASETLVEECTRSGMPYVTERWLGGTLTNFRTIRSRLERLEELETILDGEQAASYSKKMISTLTRERKKIERNLSGIRNMTRLPEALLVVDPRREHIAVAEARKLGVKVVALLDTDCDPDMVDLPVPANDDSMRSIELLIKRLTDAIIEGKATAPDLPPPSAEDERDARSGPRDRRDRDRGGRGGDRRGPGGPRDGLRMGGGPRPPAGPGQAPVPAPTPAPAPVAEAAPVAESAPAAEPTVESTPAPVESAPEAAPAPAEPQADAPAPEQAPEGA